MKPGIGSGDTGATRSLAGALRKSDCLIQATGDLDELNSALGLARSQGKDPHLDAILHRIQGELFLVGADLSSMHAVQESSTKEPTNRGQASARVTEPLIKALEHDLDTAEAELPPLANFILPAGPGAPLHVARAVCRRAERSAFGLHENPPVNPNALAYLNRLSDLLFALARLAAKRAGAAEEPWKPEP